MPLTPAWFAVQMMAYADLAKDESLTVGLAISTVTLLTSLLLLETPGWCILDLSLQLTQGLIPQLIQVCFCGLFSLLCFTPRQVEFFSWVPICLGLATWLCAEVSLVQRLKDYTWFLAYRRGQQRGEGGWWRAFHPRAQSLGNLSPASKPAYFGWSRMRPFPGAPAFSGC